MREVLFNCFGAVNVEENDNGEFVKLSDFEKLAEKCSRYIDEYERENFKFLELKESISSIEAQKAELLCRCDELEKQLETMESLPLQPIEVAKLLINSEYEYETSEFQRRFLNKGDTDTCERYNIDELEQIAEHLLIYCKHNRGCEE